MTSHGFEQLPFGWRYTGIGMVKLGALAFNVQPDLPLLSACRT